MRHVQTTPTPPLGGHAVTPTFSVIIPLHNVAPWLPECLASLRGQTLTHWEGLCVDDGSTDATGDILIQNAREDARLRVIVQPPSGVSRARNRALQRARGDAVAFLDGDDIVQTWWLEEAKRLLAETNADLVRFAFQRLYPFNKFSPNKPNRHAPQCWHGAVGPNSAALREAIMVIRQGSCWQCVFRREIAQSATFCEALHTAEDTIYRLRLASHIKCLCESDDIPYVYRIRSGSAMNTRWSVDVPLAVLNEIRILQQEATAIPRNILLHFATTIIWLWIERVRREEHQRFNEVRASYSQLLDFRRVSGIREIRPHWRLAVLSYLYFGWFWPFHVTSRLARCYGKLRQEKTHVS